MKKRHILCLLLAACLLFATACGNGEKNSNKYDPGEGRYVETDITPPIDGLFTSYLTADGTIVCFSYGLTTRYESADGGASWSESPGPGRGSERYLSAQTGTLLSDGSLLVFIMGEGLEIVSMDGSSRHYPSEEIDKAIADGESVIVSLLEALDNRLLISYMIGGFTQQTRNGAPVGAGPGPVTQDAPQGAQQISPGSTQGAQPIDPGSTQGAQPIDPGGNVQGAQPIDPGGASSPVTSENAPNNPSTPGNRTSGSTTGGPSSMSMNTKTLLCDLSTGQIIASLPVDNAMAAASDGGSLYLMDSAGNVSLYNMNDGKPSDKQNVRFSATQADPVGMRGAARMGGNGGNTLALGVDGNLYAALEGSLLFADSDGNIGTALESTAYSIGAPRNNVSSMFTLADGSIVINVSSNWQENRLYKYVWNENVTINPDKILTIWSLEDNNFVRAAISELRKKHPDSLITYEVALDGKSAVAASDAIKTLNTRLLGRDAPDVILLDGCPADNYESRGLLLDLSGLIDTSDIFDSLSGAYVNNGKLYYLPTQFLMPMLMGSADALAKVKNLDDLVSLAVNGNDLPASGASGPRPFSGVDESERSALYFTDLKELCDTLWISCAPEIVKDNRLDKDALLKYLEAIKAISDKYGLMQSGSDSGRMGMRAAFSDGGAATFIPGSLMWYTMQLTHYAAFSAGNLQLLQMMMDRVGSSLELFPGLTPGAWQPSTVVSISADATNPEFAAELIEAMLSVEVQQLNYGTGLPVTRGGLAAQVDTINARLIENGEAPFSFDPNALIVKLSSPSMGDSVLTDMMWNSLERCCKGEIDAEGAVREIEQNVKNYLAERS